MQCRTLIFTQEGSGRDFVGDVDITRAGNRMRRGTIAIGKMAHFNWQKISQFLETRASLKMPSALGSLIWVRHMRTNLCYVYFQISGQRLPRMTYR